MVPSVLLFKVVFSQHIIINHQNVKRYGRNAAGSRDYIRNISECCCSYLTWPPVSSSRNVLAENIDGINIRNDNRRCLSDTSAEAQTDQIQVIQIAVLSLSS